jgi:hypothetical protein
MVRALLSASFGLLSACSSGDLIDQLRKADLSLEKTQTRFENSDQNLGDQKITLVNTDYQTPRRIENQIDTPETNPAPVEDLKAIAIHYAHELFPLNEMKFVKIDNGFRYSYVTFQQTYKGLDVFGAKLVLRLTKSGDWKTVSATFVNQNLLTKTSEKVVKLPKSSHYFAKPHLMLRQREVFYPKRLNDAEGSETLQVFRAKEMTLFSTEDQLELWFWVDESTGELLGTYNPAVGLAPMKIVGSISPHSPSDKLIEAFFPSVTAILSDRSKISADADAVIDREKLLGMNGKVVLENPFVSVVDNAKPDSTVHLSDELLKQESLNIDSGPSPEERNIYYWIN